MLFLLIAGRQAQAIKLTSIYTSGCSKETGVILAFEKSRLTLLTIDGQVIKINSFDVRYLAEYNIDQIPMPGISGAGEIPLYSMYARQGDENVLLAKGWLIDGNNRQFGFLSERGGEFVIDINDLSRIEVEKTPESVSFANKAHVSPPVLIPPYPFIKCQTKENPDAIPPSRIISESIEILEYFQRYTELNNKIKLLNFEQKFYPKPYIYQSKDVIGIWANINSRYGSSEYRSNSLLPTYISDYSTSPFLYQHRITGGPMPRPAAPYTEPQNQLTYALKSGYFLLNLFMDFDIQLLGTRYNSTLSDFDSSSDDLLAETINLGLGFAYGNFEFTFDLVNGKFAVKNDSDLYLRNIDDSQPKIGFKYYIGQRQSLTYYTSGISVRERYTFSDLQTNTDLTLDSLPEYFYQGEFSRINYDYQSGSFSMGLSFISRTTNFTYAANLIGTELEAESPPFAYEAERTITAIFLNYLFTRKFEIRSHLHFETKTSRSGKAVVSNEEVTDSYSGGGIGLFIAF